MLKLFIKLGIGLFILSLISVTHAEDEAVLHREGEPDYYEKFNTTRMDKAIAEAKSTINIFISALKSNNAADENFALKKGFKFGDSKEFIWISDIKLLNGDTFQGIINNDPVNDVGVKYGQTVTLKKNEIADWMYIKNKKLVGGYTLVALTYGTPAQQQYEANYGITWSDYKFLHLK